MAKYVAPQFRTHPWSFTQGGAEVVVTLDDGRAFKYDRVKDPEKYIAEVMLSNKNLESIKLDGRVMWAKNGIVCAVKTVKKRVLIPISEYNKRMAA